MSIIFLLETRAAFFSFNDFSTEQMEGSIFHKKLWLYHYMSCAIGTKKWCESNNLCFDGWR
jgi:hypothetical protein